MDLWISIDTLLLPRVCIWLLPSDEQEVSKLIVNNEK